MKEIRRGDVLLHLAPVRQLLVFPAHGTSYVSYLFSSLSGQLAFTCFPAQLYFFLHLGVVAHFPALLRFCCPIFSPRLMLFTCLSNEFSFYLFIVASVLSISEMILFSYGRSLRKLCYGEVYESQNITVNPTFFNPYLPYSQIPSDFQITWNPRMRSTAGFCYYSK